VNKTNIALIPKNNNPTKTPTDPTIAFSLAIQ